MITSDEDIPAVVADINEKIQAIQNYLGHRNLDSARIRFPRGYLRSCSTHKQKYPFLESEVLKSNIAYAKMTTDIYQWILNRTDISLTAKEMIIKQGIALLGSVAETIVKEFLKGQPGGGRKQNFKKKVEKLTSDEVISEELQKDLCWLWDTRNGLHLMLLEQKEYNKYSIGDYNRATIILKNLRVALGGTE
ncbi:hypothetical protein [Vibrio alginolyticus]|uniref:hypothetical protein n=1 Tax=Vibrio alginolyticus TaxID=663 RepID=UPI001BD2C249|nr:hypothetical protein [Vibrio alginolyticus]MBS9812702.1 hypothetical protein [Vibrio alginolyticus]